MGCARGRGSISRSETAAPSASVAPFKRRPGVSLEYRGSRPRLPFRSLPLLCVEPRIPWLALAAPVGSRDFSSSSVRPPARVPDPSGAETGASSRAPTPPPLLRLSSAGRLVCLPAGGRGSSLPPSLPLLATSVQVACLPALRTRPGSRNRGTSGGCCSSCCCYRGTDAVNAAWCLPSCPVCVFVSMEWPMRLLRIFLRSGRVGAGSWFGEVELVRQGSGSKWEVVDGRMENANAAPPPPERRRTGFSLARALVRAGVRSLAGQASQPA